MIQSKCGLKCNECKWAPKTNCPSCIEAHGRPFHGECPIAICCGNRNLLHCGQCGNFPCQQLTEYAYDKEHGDNGTRIETLKQWLIHRFYLNMEMFSSGYGKFLVSPKMSQVLDIHYH